MNELLDTLVRLASLGASGISIFAIFWIGWLLLRLPSDASPERHRTLRYFILACFGIALITGATGLANAKFNAETISVLTQKISDNTAEIDQCKNVQNTARGILGPLLAIVESKQIAAAASGSEEVERQVQTIKEVIKQLKEAIE